jgi:fructokinase
MSKQLRLLSCGYVALDVIRHGGSVRQSAGGTAANVAANLAHLGWQSTLIGRIGADPQARRILTDLRTSGVCTRLLVRDSATETPVVVHEVLPPRHRFDFSCPECGRTSPRYRSLPTEHLEERAPETRAIASSDVVFVDRASAFSAELLQRARQGGALTVFEPSARGAESASLRAAEYAGILKWSAETRPRLHPSTLNPRAHQLQIESMAARGLRYRVGDGSWSSLHPPAIEALDGAGAGDWLTTGLLDALPHLDLASLDEDAIGDALSAGQALAALSCRYVGARALARIPAADIRVAAEQLVKGQDFAVPRPTGGRRSQAKNVCQVCLGPT